MKLIKLLLTLGFALGLLTITNLSSAYQFPIPELGDCQNQKECHLYCEVPQNQPACWSYRVYKTAVLGETSTDEALTQLGFTFPIASLGNCANRDECKNYCQDSANLAACKTFSQNIRQIVNQKLLEKAQAELGCTTAEACKAFCSEEQNKSLCTSFGRKWKIKSRVKTTVLNQAATTLGCQTLADCKSMCEQEENKDTCRSFAQNLGLKIRMSLKEKLGCATNEDCRKLCAENPDKCPGYPKLASPNLENLQRKILPQKNVTPLKPTNLKPLEVNPTDPAIEVSPATEVITDTIEEQTTTSTESNTTQF